MSKLIALTLTLATAAGSVVWGVIAELSMDQWLVMLQSLGTMLALLWVIYANMLHERTGNRDVVLQSLDLIRPDLEDLTKSIEIELDKLGTKTASYVERYRNGERTAYIVPLTADNGRRLRKLRASDALRTPQLERRLQTYVSMFQPIMDMSEKDEKFHQVIEASPLGRAYLAIKAAQAGDDDSAQLFIDRLAAHDTGKKA